jgi:predicted flavoprotein YhiN
MNSRRVVVAGGGAAGFFAAIACAEAAPGLEVILLEKGPQFLSKVRISGGGRCNVTHACFDAREFAAHYSRGEQEMIGLLRRFQASDTVAWFESRGVKLKTERDGRIFPTTDSSQTIIDCLLGAARAAGVKLHLNRGLEAVTKRADGAFELRLTPPDPRVRTGAGQETDAGPLAPSVSQYGGGGIPRTGPRLEPLNRSLTRPEGTLSPSEGERERERGPSIELRFIGRVPFRAGEGASPGTLGFDRSGCLSASDGATLSCDGLLLATGGCRGPALGQIAVSLGHTLESPVPSLFTFHIETPWLRELAGVSVESVEVSVPGTNLRERGPVLLTHWGLSGPAILRLSAWGARHLHGLDYRFPLHVKWLPHLTSEALASEFKSRREAQPARLVANTPLPALSARLWERLVRASGIAADTRWSALSRSGRHQLVQQLLRTELPVTGKSLNKDEFVTCGGVRLSEVNLKTMESRLCPGLYFAGELLDIDGLTGGFNFQAAWTTGWIAGNAMACI